MDRAEVTRLGEGLNETGEIQPEPLERTVRAAETIAEEAKRNQVLGSASNIRTVPGSGSWTAPR